MSLSRPLVKGLGRFNLEISMPTNKLIYFGVIVIAASALLWLGAELAKRVEWILPYTGVAGVLLCFIGLFMELQKKKSIEEVAELPSAIESASTPVSSKPSESVPVEPN